ncbi:hypothetical protein AB0J86_11335 [Micromonospora sp. NPDC049559]|uniref:hypothetical protein n=1 Tax=Micromonospora sp. NPDC049559 TaxID=3155923 RepID=UPI00343C67A5
MILATTARLPNNAGAPFISEIQLHVPGPPERRPIGGPTEEILEMLEQTALVR